MKKFKYLYTSLFLAFIAAVCLINFSDVSDKVHIFSGFDKVVHGGMYFVLSYIFIWEYRDRKHLLPGKNGNIYEPADHLYRVFWCVLLLCAVVGGLIEYLQGQTGYRSKETADLTADLMGGLFACLVYYLLVMTHRNK